MPDLQTIKNGDPMSEWFRKINGVIEHVNSIDVSGQGWTYAGTFEASDFTSNGAHFQLRVTSDVHGLGSIVTLKSFLRKLPNGDFTNVVHSFKVFVNGTIVILADEVFDGKFIIEREV